MPFIYNLHCTLPGKTTRPPWDREGQTRRRLFRDEMSTLRVTRSRTTSTTCAGSPRSSRDARACRARRSKQFRTARQITRAASRLHTSSSRTTRTSPGSMIHASKASPSSTKYATHPIRRANGGVKTDDVHDDVHDVRRQTPIQQGRPGLPRAAVEAVPDRATDHVRRVAPASELRAYGTKIARIKDPDVGRQPALHQIHHTLRSPRKLPVQRPDIRRVSAVEQVRETLDVPALQSVFAHSRTIARATVLERVREAIEFPVPRRLFASLGVPLAAVLAGVPETFQVPVEGGVRRTCAGPTSIRVRERTAGPRGARDTRRSSTTGRPGPS